VQPAGSPLQITASAGGAAFPAVAGDPAGDFIAAWSAPALQGTAAIMVQRLDAAGHPLGAAVAVSQSGAIQGRPRIAMGAGSGMVVWNEDGNIRARLLTAAGQPAGDVIAVYTPIFCCAGAPDIAALQPSGFALVWDYAIIPIVDPVPPADDPIARLYNAAGEPLGDTFPVTTEPASGATQARVAADPAGGFAVAWEDAGSFLGALLEARRFTAEGKRQGPVIQVTAEHGAFGPVPVYAPGGELSVAWANPGGDSFSHPAGLFAQRIAADGSLAGSAITLAGGPLRSTPPDVAAAPSGQRLLVWAAPGAGADSPSEIRARLFDAVWQPLQPAFRAGLFTPWSLPTLPVAASGAAGFLATWDGLRAPGDPVPQVAGQLLTAPATALCTADAASLCLAGDRFRVEVVWHDPRSGARGTGNPIPLTGDTGAFWFFSAGNAELLVKVLDGRTNNGHWWVFFGALSDLEFDIRVTDTLTLVRKIYHNPPYTVASRADISAFVDPIVRAAAPDNEAALAAPAPVTACPAGACLGEFQVSVDFLDPITLKRRQAVGVPLSENSAYFWFFDAGNVELAVKVLDGRAVNGHWWVFYGALTNLDYTIRVDWPAQHRTRFYHNPGLTMQSLADTKAF
jgi:hypothetical protein